MYFLLMLMFQQTLYGGTPSPPKMHLKPYTFWPDMPPPLPEPLTPPIKIVFSNSTPFLPKDLSRLLSRPKQDKRKPTRNKTPIAPSFLHTTLYTLYSKTRSLYYTITMTPPIIHDTANTNTAIISKTKLNACGPSAWRCASASQSPTGAPPRSSETRTATRPPASPPLHTPHRECRRSSTSRPRPRPTRRRPHEAESCLPGGAARDARCFVFRRLLASTGSEVGGRRLPWWEE